jgi:hypothetical protein
MSSALVEKIRQLREKFIDDQDQQTINAWEVEVKRAMMVDDLKRHPAIKMLLEQIEQVINDVNQLLCWDRKLSEKERELLFIKREVWLWWQNIFNTADAKISEIDSQADENLKN